MSEPIKLERFNRSLSDALLAGYLMGINDSARAMREAITGACPDEGCACACEAGFRAANAMLELKKKAMKK